MVWTHEEATDTANNPIDLAKFLNNYFYSMFMIKTPRNRNEYEDHLPTVTISCVPLSDILESLKCIWNEN